MATTNFEKVCDFNKTFDFPILGHCTIALDNAKIANLRINLIQEEGIEEFKKALDTNDKIEMLDSIADHLYVLYGLCYTYSFDPDYYIRLTHNNIINNKKLTGCCCTNNSPEFLLLECQKQYNNKKLTNYELIYNTIHDYKKCETDVFIKDIFKENCDLVEMLKKAMLETKDIVETYIITMCLIVNTYKLGIYLSIDVDKLFDIIHNSNMSKLCITEEEAKQTVEKYKNNYETGNSPYDSPYYYKSQNYYIVKNRSSGKSLKSINYTAVKINIDELTVV